MYSPIGWSQHRRFHRHAFKNPLRHGRATDDTTLVYNSADVDVTLRDVGIKCRGSAGFLLENLTGATLLQNGHVQR